MQGASFSNDRDEKSNYFCNFFLCKNYLVDLTVCGELQRDVKLLWPVGASCKSFPSCSCLT